MIEATQITLFDIQQKIVETHGLLNEYRGLIKRTVEIAMRIGDNLLFFRDQTEHGKHGRFLPWLDAEFALSQRTAYNFMSLAESKDKLKFAIIANLPLYILYELAPESTPVTVVEMVATQQIPATIPAIREAKREYHEAAPTIQPTLTEHEAALAGYRGYERWQEAHKWEKKLHEVEQAQHSEVEEDEKPEIDEKEKRDAHVMRVMGSSESPEWYTPQEIIDLVCQMFIEIDTDPCSNSHTNPVIPAHTLYTKEDNGLIQTWKGKTYLNPPYGAEISQWTDKLIFDYKQRHIEEALALLPARIDTAWFSPLYEYLMCNVRGRIQYANSPYSAPFPCVVVYLGTRVDEFVRVFKNLGPIMRRIA